MRFRILVTAAALVGFAGAGTLIARGAGACGASTVCCVEQHDCCDHASSPCCAANQKESTPTQWSIMNFAEPVMVNRTLVSGPVLIVHDDAKMARGEPCTTFYRFEKGVGPKEALVSFHCTPRRTSAVQRTTVTTATTDIGLKRLVEYQFGGDTEAHGVPR